MQLFSPFFLPYDDLRGHVLFHKSKKDGEGLPKYIEDWWEREINIHWVRHWDLGLHLSSTQEQVWPCLAHVKVSREIQREKKRKLIHRNRTLSWEALWTTIDGKSHLGSGVSRVLVPGPCEVYCVLLPLFSLISTNVLQCFHVLGISYVTFCSPWPKKSLTNSTRYG